VNANKNPTRLFVQTDSLVRKKKKMDLKFRQIKISEWDKLNKKKKGSESFSTLMSVHALIIF